MIRKRIVKWLSMLWIVLFTGCSTVGYYFQIINGQISILNHRQSMVQLIKNDETPEEVKQKIRLILELRDFAETELHLPVNNNYLSYVDLNRPFVLWNVFATPEFSLTPKSWCYPIIGCATYRGYFSREDANEYALILKSEGFDVYVGGTVAYSTLGWFDDPVLSTFMRLNPTRIAALIFHELAHQLLYVSDDTAFNESFATAVEREGVSRWLKARNNTDAYNEYVSDYTRHQAFVDLIMKFQDRLTSLYEKELPSFEKRREKATIFEGLKAEYHLLKQQWNGYTGYDNWFGHELNNAQMITVSTYYEWIPAFLTLLANQEQDMEKFYGQCKKLAECSRDARWDYLNSLLKERGL